MPQQQQIPPIELLDLRGLSLKLDVDVRDPSSWTVLNNFDNYVNGSIRKVLPPIIYGQSPGQLILSFLDYRTNDSGPRSIIGFGADSKLYNLTSGAQVGDCSAFVPPSGNNICFLGMMPGTRIPYNFRNWQATTAYALNDALLRYSYQDGLLYIFVVTTAGTTGATEKAYPNTGTLTDGSVVWTNIGLQANFRFAQNYLIIQVPGQRMLKWDGTNVTQVGVTAPGAPVNANPTITTPNLNGYAPLSGVFYYYTLFNPQTLHESSPSPITASVSFYAVDKAAITTVPGSFVPPLPVTAVPSVTGGAANLQIQSSSYQQIKLCLATSALTPAVGQGFTHVRFYRTKDGGSTFYLLTQLFDGAGHVITNSDGSVPISALITGSDYTPLPTPQSVQPVSCVYEGYGQPNNVPGAITLDANNWTDISSGKIYLVIGGGQNNSNAFRYNGTGAASGPLARVSNAFMLSGGTYTFQAYIDATSVTAGSVIWFVAAAGSSTPLITLTQTNGSKGLLTSAPTALPAGSYYVSAQMSATVTNNAFVNWSDPILQLGSAISTIGYPAMDASLVTPGPEFGANDPPPVGEWAAIYGNSLFVLDEIDKVKLWFSDTVDFESFGKGSYLRFPSDTDDQITSILGTFSDLIIGKRRLTEKLTLTQQLQFMPGAIDPVHGILGKRAVVSLGSQFLGLLNVGLSILGLSIAVPTPFELQLGYAQRSFVGDDIQPLTDAIPPSAQDRLICFAYDTKRDIILFAIQQNAANVYNDLVLMLSAARGPRFSSYSALVTGRHLIAIREVELPSGMITVLATCDDKNTYQLFSGTQDGSVVAQAVSQPLPMPQQIDRSVWNQRKEFISMWVDGVDLSNFQVSYSIDGMPFSKPVALANNNLIGLHGKRLQIQFTHSVASSAVPAPMLTYINIDWQPVGVTR